MGGRYRLIRRIGEGGMGVVWLAHHESLDREVVVKLVRRGDDDQGDRRFALEARLASALAHPHIVAVHDFGEEDGDLYLVMERLEGASLHERMRDTRASWSWSLERVRQIALALEAAHARGVIHRDLKPGNVFLVHQGGMSDFVKVLDFGLAREIDAGDDAGSLTRTGELIGTPGYISPEQIEGEGGDARSDLYALGVIWYELLVGMNPFRASSAVKTLIRHLEEVPRSLREAGVELPPEGDRLILRLLAKDPTRRPADAGELLQLLRPLLGEQAGPGSSTRALGEEGPLHPPHLTLLLRRLVPFAAVLGVGLTLALGAVALPPSVEAKAAAVPPADPSLEPLYALLAPPVDKPLAELGKRLYHRGFAPVPPSPEAQEKRRKAGLEPAPAHTRPTSCAGCHPVSGYGTTPEAQTRMTFDHSPAPLNAPSTLNAYWNFRQKWDASVEDLVGIVAVPVQSPWLMQTSWDSVLAEVRADKDLARRFAELGLPISSRSFTLAVAEYMKWLVPTDSPFDLWQTRGHDPGPDVKRGYQRFKDLGCVACHQGRGVGGNMTATLGVMRDASSLRGRCYSERDGRERVYHSMCVSDEGCALEGQGRCDFTQKTFPGDMWNYKVPSLRNVAMTAPYFHDGSAKTLAEAVRVMAALQLGVDIGVEDERAIVSFLQSLTGKIAPAALEGP